MDVALYPVLMWGHSVADVDDLERRLNGLSRALHAFAEAAPDYEQLLDIVARTLADVVKDGCVVRLLHAETLSPVAVHLPTTHVRDEAIVAQLREHIWAPHLLDEHPAAKRVLETGEPLLVPHLDVEQMRSSASPEVVHAYETIGIHSLLLVALRVRGEPIGLLALVRFAPGSAPFSTADRDLAQGLADHAALAIANSRAYAAERHARASTEKAHVALRESEARYRLMFDASPIPKWLYDIETLRFLEVNNAALRQYGYTRPEFLSLTLKDIRPPEDVPALLEAVHSPRVSTSAGVWRHRKKSGEIIQAEVTIHDLTFGGRACRLAVAKDVTERLRLEAQLRQSQKMEAVGLLAGGVAHDFNNVLFVILSYTDALLTDLPPREPMRRELDEIRKAAQRAADLTKQLLVFSRQQVLAPTVLDLNEVLVGVDNMLQRIVGADIDLVFLAGTSIGRVVADRSCIEQVIVNLVVNARDAMPTGGKLTMETANVVLDEAYVHGHVGSKPGAHVMLAITDTGIGMDDATTSRIFEPFFTTKPSGKGTGLGLSTVLGIAQQSGGSVWVYSELGKGTTFKVYLPCIDEAAVVVARATQSPITLRGTETILLVEDDDQVRGVVKTILRKNGYQVLEARSAGEALLVAEQHQAEIHLLLSDVVMPQMSGPELATRLMTTRPSTKVLCMSGYTDDSIVRHGVLREKLHFLQKPLTPHALTSKVREVLDA